MSGNPARRSDWRRAALVLGAMVAADLFGAGHGCAGGCELKPDPCSPGCGGGRAVGCPCDVDGECDPGWCDNHACSASGARPIGAHCSVDSDCASANCVFPPQCFFCRDGKCGAPPPVEAPDAGGIPTGCTDVDCGGACLLRCVLGQHCEIDLDCYSLTCRSGVCVAPRHDAGDSGPDGALDGEADSDVPFPQDGSEADAPDGF